MGYWEWDLFAVNFTEFNVCLIFEKVTDLTPMTPYRENDEFFWLRLSETTFKIIDLGAKKCVW